MNRHTAYAKGYRQKGEPGMLRIGISFDDETFAAINRLARKARISFNEQVRNLVEFGLEDITR